MTPSRRQIRADLPAELDEPERDALAALGLRLAALRPQPRRQFRDALRARLVGSPRLDRNVDRAVPFAPRRLAAAYALAGTLLLAVAAIGVAGAGPFAQG